MSRRNVGRAAVAAALCLALAGCFGPGGSWQIPTFMLPPAPPAPPTHHYPPSVGGELNNSTPASENERNLRHLREPQPPVADEPVAAATPAPSSAVPIPKPTVTLAGGPSKERAQHLLDETEAKLAKIDRSSLSADSATTYDQANSFLQAGRRAASETDYVAATGLAEKAAVLAAKLVASSP
jgi:hypothetical protein